jgi:hypothetical protein
MRKNIKNTLTIIIILTIVTVSYFIITDYLKNYFVGCLQKKESFKNNEFGDFIGGLINPLFTLLSTVSIIYLTYIIARKEEDKSEKAIETQKRLTLNQMRQNALENLIQKTNLYVYENNKLSIHAPENKFHQMLLTSMIENENQMDDRANVWLIILSELENFTQLKYLFSDLFESITFKEKHNAIIEVTSKLCDEQNKFKFVKSKTIEDFINIQQDFLTLIGNYIYSEF